jgi:tRNA (guanine-N7-)-methyltransferase
VGEERRFQLYGRRTGRALRPAQVSLLAEHLPRLRIDLAPSRTLHPSSLFPEDKRDVWLEIGFGAGEHLVSQARAHPTVGFIGAEPFRNGVAKLVSALVAESIANVRIVDDDARPLIRVLAPATLGRVFLLFPDPWPKARHSRRRFIDAGNLDAIHRILRPGGELRVASDMPDYVRWTLVAVRRHGGFAWRAREPADWRVRPSDASPTRYELKALKSGRVPTYLSFVRLA